MSKARYARFRPVRGFGWAVALPVAVIVFAAVWLVSGSASVGLVLGAGVSIVGLAILTLGYSLGEIWGGYWMNPVALTGVNIALVTYVFGGQWLWALAGTGGFIVMAALAAAISRTAASDGGLFQLLGHFFRGLIPGQYPR